MGLDVNTETVAVLDYGFTDRKTAKAISELSDEEAGTKAKSNFDNHLEQFSDMLSEDKINRLKALAELNYLKGLFGEPQDQPTDMTQVMEGISSKKHKKDDSILGFSENGFSINFSFIDKLVSDKNFNIFFLKCY